MPDALVEAVAERAQKLNEKSKGKEGGRVVRRLIADWVESPLQRESTRQPDAYKVATAVELVYTPAGGDRVESDVRVTFTPRNGDGHAET